MRWYLARWYLAPWNVSPSAMSADTARALRSRVARFTGAARTAMQLEVTDPAGSGGNHDTGAHDDSSNHHAAA